MAQRKAIQVGQKVLLWWDGFPEVPRWLSGSVAEVIGFTRTGRPRVRVFDGEIRAVRPDQCREVPLDA